MGGRADLRSPPGRPLHLLRRQEPSALGPGPARRRARPALEALWKRNYSVYGRRKLTKAARRAGHDVGRDQVARLMRCQGIRGASRAKKRFTTKSDPEHVRAPDLVNRNFHASRPDELWVCDFTSCSTWSGIVYVAFVIDVFSRRLVGWKAARSMTTTLVLDALNMAAWTRRHSDLAGVMCHSDAGSQGEINWLSQHLDSGGVTWRRCESVSARSSSTVGTFPHQEGPESRGVKTGSSSGRRSRAA